MLKQSLCGAAVLLTLASPALADRAPAPALSGTYTYTSNVVCYLPGTTSPLIRQNVGEYRFHPHDGTAKLTVQTNFLDPGIPVRTQRDVNLTQHYEIHTAHKMNFGGLEAYVQFGAVVNGIATSANLLYTNQDGSCTFQDTFTQSVP